MVCPARGDTVTVPLLLSLAVRARLVNRGDGCVALIRGSSVRRGKNGTSSDANDGEGLLMSIDLVK